LIQIVRQRPFAVEILDQTPLPRRRQIEGGNKSGEQADIAETDLRGLQAVECRRLQSEREHFGVGRCLVVASERLDAGLQDFGCRAFAMTEYRAQVAIARRLAG
jgi:hypothetical protein